MTKRRSKQFARRPLSATSRSKSSRVGISETTSGPPVAPGNPQDLADSIVLEQDLVDKLREKAPSAPRLPDDAQAHRPRARRRILRPRRVPRGH